MSNIQIVYTFIRNSDIFFHRMKLTIHVVSVKVAWFNVDQRIVQSSNGMLVLIVTCQLTGGISTQTKIISELRSGSV